MQRASRAGTLPSTGFGWLAFVTWSGGEFTWRRLGLLHLDCSLAGLGWRGDTLRRNTGRCSPALALALPPVQVELAGWGQEQDSYSSRYRRRRTDWPLRSVLRRRHRQACRHYPNRAIPASEGDRQRLGHRLQACQAWRLEDLLPGRLPLPAERLNGSRHLDALSSQSRSSRYGRGNCTGWLATA